MPPANEMIPGFSRILRSSRISEAFIHSDRLAYAGSHAGSSSCVISLLSVQPRRRYDIIVDLFAMGRPEPQDRAVPVAVPPSCALRSPSRRGDLANFGQSRSPCPPTISGLDGL